MTEEEKKAIQNIEEMIESIFKCEDDEEFVCDIYDGACLQTALNLIQKQDKKIKDLKEHNSNLIKKSGEDIDLLLKQIDSKDTEINKLNNVIDKYRQEREYIKNNLEVDLQRKGVLAQAKGQIAQILEYYKNNDEYFMKE